jgi:hypothetical protein
MMAAKSKTRKAPAPSVRSQGPAAMPPTRCPVAALMVDSGQLIKACIENSYGNDDLDDAISSILAFATTRRSRSLEGVLFHVILAYDQVDSIKNGTTENIRNEAYRAVRRLLWSIREGIVLATGVKPDETVAEYYMAKSKYAVDAHIVRALSLAEELRKDAAGA